LHGSSKKSDQVFLTAVQVPERKEVLIYFPFADWMPAFASDVRHFFHRFALHAAIFSSHSCARAVGMSAFLWVVASHFSSAVNFISSSPGDCSFSEESPFLIPERIKDKRILNTWLFKIAHWIRLGRKLPELAAAFMSYLT
jgi:hypothetical protein